MCISVCTYTAVDAHVLRFTYTSWVCVDIFYVNLSICALVISICAVYVKHKCLCVSYVNLGMCACIVGICAAFVHFI